MNKIRLIRLLKLAQRKIEEGAPVPQVAEVMKKCAGEFGDPFANEMDEFLKKKQGEGPQDTLEEKSMDEGAPAIPEDPKETTQDQIEEKTEDATEDNAEEGSGDKTGTSVEPAVEALLKAIAKEVQDRGHPEISKKLALSSAPAQVEVVPLLNSLLKAEYLQRDLYESTDYLLLGPEAIAVQEHLREHIEQEMTHIQLLQRYIVNLGGTPTLERDPLPAIAPLTLAKVLEKDLELENLAVANYIQAISSLEGDAAHTALRVDLENILVQEQEHVHDIMRWLNQTGQAEPAPVATADETPPTMYKNLNDAAMVNPKLSGLKRGNTKIYHFKNAGNLSRDLMMGYDWLQDHRPDLVPHSEEDLKKTHVLVGEVQATDLDDIFMLMQGEVWSSRGEARDMIKALDTHTSMSVGDVIVVNGKIHMVDRDGFSEI